MTISHDDNEKIRETYLNIVLSKTMILEMTMIQNRQLDRYKNSDNAHQKRYIHENIVETLKHNDYSKIITHLKDNNVFLDLFYLDKTDRYVMFVLSKREPVRLIYFGKGTELNRTMKRENFTECYPQIFIADSSDFSMKKYRKRSSSPRQMRFHNFPLKRL